MSPSCRVHPNPGATLLRLVGDPIDIVTGAVVERTLDAWLPGLIPFAWQRYYHSSQTHQQGALGWGHRHSFEHALHFDLDGVRYVRPDGTAIGFSHPGAAGVPQPRGDYSLIVEHSGLYVIQPRREPAIEFVIHAETHIARATRITWSGRQALRLQYGEGGLLRHIIDTADRWITLLYDDAGRIIELTLSSTDQRPPAALVRYEYDEPGRLSRLIDAYGGDCRFRYDGENRIVERRERSGYRVWYTFDAAGRCIQSTGEDGVLRFQLAYASDMRRTIVTRADGGRWDYYYDETGLVTRLIDPYGIAHEYQYGESGEITELTPEGPQVFQGLPYSPGRQRPTDLLPESRHYPGLIALGMLSRFRPGCAAACEYGSRISYRNFRYPRGTMELVTVPAEVRPYIRVGELHVNDPLRCEAEGRVYTGPSEQASAWDDYDRFGKWIRRTTPSGASESWTYDATGSVRTYRDPDGARWEYEYESWNHLRAETDPNGHQTRFAHSMTEQLTSVTDPGHTTTYFSYDLRDRIIHRHREDGSSESFAYGISATPRTRQLGNTRLEFVRGKGGRVQQILLPDGSHHDFLYDDRGRCIQAESPAGCVELAYNSSRDLMADKRNGLGIEHADDENGHRLTTILGQFTIQTIREPDASTTLVDPTHRRHRISISGNGLIKREFSNGVCEWAQYDWEGRCLLKARLGVRGPVRARQYEYSLAGDLLNIAENGAVTNRFTYDAAHRLISRQSPKTNGPPETFQYDAAGNLVGHAGLHNAVFGPADQLRYANDRTYAYADQGCLAQIDGAGETELFSYDAFAQLVRHEAGDRWWSAEYDAFGRRTRVQSTDREVEYWWDGERLMAEHTIGRRFRVYVYVDREALVPMLVVDYASPKDDPASGQVYFLFTDQLGTPAWMEDETGVVCWEGEAQPFGSMRISPASRVELQLRFPGHQFDPETGLHYNRHRYYDPVLGRYLQPDPLDVSGGLNVYAGTPRPTSSVDVDGLMCPLKPIGKNDEEGQDYKQRAQDLANALQQQMGGAAASTTYAVFVIDQGGQRRLVVFSNRDGPPPPWVVQTANAHGAQFIPTTPAPPNVATERQDPKTGAWQPTNGHAEQRGMAWADQNSNANGGNVRAVNSISPTQGCCSGCNAAIENRGTSTSSMVAPPNPRTPTLQRGEGELGYDPTE